MTVASKLALVYARISGQDDERTASLESQVENGRRRAVAIGAIVRDEDTYRERFTGAELYNRPLLCEVRAKIRTGRYDYLIVHAIDRLARKMAYLAILAEECELHGCRLVSATEDIDNSPEGELIRTIKAYVAEVEREKIRERTTRGRSMILARGQHPCTGWASFGYQYDRATRTVALDPPAAAIVHDIFEWVAGGLSSKEVCRRLNAAGVPTPRERRGHKFKDGRSPRWGDPVIQRMIRNRDYLGEPVQYGKTRCQGRRPNGRPRQVPVHESEWQTIIALSPPRIVEDDLFLRANASLSDRYVAANRTRSARRPRLLRGILRCYCGQPMQPVTNTFNGKQYHYYKCASARPRKGMASSPCGAKGVRVDYADQKAWSDTILQTKDRGAMRARFEAALSAIEGGPVKADAAAAALAVSRLERQQATLKEKWARSLGEDDADFAALVEGQLKRCMAELRAVRIEWEATRARLASLEDRAGVLGRLEETLDAAEADLANPQFLSFEMKRKHMESLGVTATWDGRELVVEALPISAFSLHYLRKTERNRAGITSS